MGPRVVGVRWKERKEDRATPNAAHAGPVRLSTCCANARNTHRAAIAVLARVAFAHEGRGTAAGKPCDEDSENGEFFRVCRPTNLSN